MTLSGPESELFQLPTSPCIAWASANGTSILPDTRSRNLCLPHCACRAVPLQQVFLKSVLWYHRYATSSLQLLPFFPYWPLCSEYTPFTPIVLSKQNNSSEKCCTQCGPETTEWFSGRGNKLMPECESALSLNLLFGSADFLTTWRSSCKKRTVDLHAATSFLHHDRPAL